MTLELADDYLLFDGLVTVELWLPGAAEAIEVAGALRRAAHHQEAAPADGGYRRADTVWHLPVATLAERPPLGSLIVAPGGEAWTVLEVSQQTLATWWRCATRGLTIEPGPDAEIDILRAVWEVDAAGAPLARYETLAAATPARVVRVATDQALTQDERRADSETRVYLALRLDVRPDDRVVHGERVYRVVRVEGLQRIDRLPELIVEETR